MKRKIFLATLVVGITLLAGSVFAQGMKSDMPGPEMKGHVFCPMYGHKDGMLILKMSKDLNLSQDQQDKIFNIILQTKQKNDSLRTELLKVRYEISKEMSKDKPDFDKLKSLNSQVAKLQSEIKLNIDNSRIDIMSTLTPQQINKLKELAPKPMRKGKIDEDGDND